MWLIPRGQSSFSFELTGSMIAVAVLDVKVAFDSLRHGAIERALQTMCINPSAVTAAIRDLTCKTAVIRVPGAGDSDCFEFNKGGWQGGPTPQIFLIWS